MHHIGNQSLASVTESNADIAERYHQLVEDPGYGGVFNFKLRQSRLHIVNQM
jgi:hypothetical protein